MNNAKDLSRTARNTLEIRVCRFKTVLRWKSHSAWARESRRNIRPGEKPCAHLLIKGEEFDLFSEEQTVLMRPLAQTQPATEIDLLAAIFTVTRVAKRYRDLAQKHYRAERYGLATSCRKRKEAL